jgi:hypothetical protein
LEKKISFFIINAILLAALIYLKGEIFVLFDSDRPKMLGKKPPEWMRFSWIF